MFIEQSKVSRKTPKDGKLEITEGAAAQVRALPPRFPLVVNGAHGSGMLAELRCTCRGADHVHTHHFLESELLKRLAADSEVSIDLREEGVVVVDNAQMGY